MSAHATMAPAGLLRLLRAVHGVLRHGVLRAVRPVRQLSGGCASAWRAGGLSGLAAHARRRGRILALRLVGGAQSEDELADAAMEYWNAGGAAGIDVGDYSHWRGAGPWRDHARWLALGRVHLDMYARFVRYRGAGSPRHIIEWGCGGGANAVHFAPEAETYWGIDIAASSLDECGQVLGESGFGGWKPVLVDAREPENAVLAVPPGDLFLCTYVFELLPGRRYGERICRVARELLVPGGFALIQIRYDDGTERNRQKNIDYWRNACRFTSWRIDDFWRLLEQCGLRPHYVELVPEQVEGVSGDRYAYFLAERLPDGHGQPAGGFS